MVRLNKFITDAGYCSRREADAYIAQGRVTVNGVDAVIGSSVGEGDLVEVDGERVGRKPKRYVYIALNKPVGITCTTDSTDKTNIVDFVKYKERIFPVGRLDKDSEGLIIMTNNGDIVNKILRAGNNNPKEYIVTVDKPITGEFLKQMSSGVRILGVRTKPCEVKKRNPNTFTIFLTQGLNRQIRRMCQALGYTVVALKRVRVMNITLGTLEVGKWRYFTPQEVADMHVLLASSSGTEEASNENRGRAGSAPKRTSRPKPKSGRDGQPEKNQKSGWPEKIGKSGKPATPGEFGISGKSGKSEKAVKFGKSGGTEKSGRPAKPEKSGKFESKSKYADYRQRGKSKKR